MLAILFVSALCIVTVANWCLDMGKLESRRVFGDYKKQYKTLASLFKILGVLLGIIGCLLVVAHTLLIIWYNVFESYTLFGLGIYLIVNSLMHYIFRQKIVSVEMYNQVMETISGDNAYQSELADMEHSFTLLKNAVDVKKFDLADKVKSSDVYNTLIGDMDSLIEKLKVFKCEEYVEEYRIYLLIHVAMQSDIFKDALNMLTSNKEPEDVIKLLSDSVTHFKKVYEVREKA